MEVGLHTQYLINKNLLLETAIATVLLAYVLLIVYGTKYVYNFFRGRGMKHNVAVYYNRKLIHILAGGVVAVLVPTVFTGALIPLILALVLALLTYMPHRSGELMYWFQVKENMYEVNFCIMWGLALTVSWLILGSPIYGILPVIFMSFGDAVTGIVRNGIFAKRTKHWVGNVAMLAVTLPVGLALAGVAGAVAAGASSLVEHFEIPPIDDNVLISLTATVVLIAASALGAL